MITTFCSLLVTVLETLYAVLLGFYHHKEDRLTVEVVRGAESEMWSLLHPFRIRSPALQREDLFSGPSGNYLCILIICVSPPLFNEMGRVIPIGCSVGRLYLCVKMYFGLLSIVYPDLARSFLIVQNAQGTDTTESESVTEDILECFQFSWQTVVRSVTTLPVRLSLHIVQVYPKDNFLVLLWVRGWGCLKFSLAFQI